MDNPIRTLYRLLARLLAPRPRPLAARLLACSVLHTTYNGSALQ